ncbi:MAG: right-handed parallel beta-helix repeat-containing protein [Planctomycetota bacterium]
MNRCQLIRALASCVLTLASIDAVLAQGADQSAGFVTPLVRGDGGDGGRDRLGATTYYCDPVAGKLTNDGKSPATAWSSLESIANADYFTSRIASGDTVLLLSGNHGYVQLQNVVYDDWVTISGADGELAGIEGFRGYSIERVILENVWVTPQLADQFFVDNRGLIWIGRNNSANPRSRFVQVRYCRVFSVFDASAWTPHDWATLASNGIALFDVQNGLLEHNIVANSYTAITLVGSSDVVRRNWIDGFAGDGMFSGGTDNVIDDNLITNVYEDDTGYHNDGMQFYSAGAGNSVTVRRNVIVATTDPGRAASIHLQGITSFDEALHDSVIENNYVISDTTHGISFTGGGDHCRFVNNTVYGFRDGGGSPMRINGTWTDTLVRNNLVTNLFSDGSNDHNIVIKSPSDAPQYFVDPSRLAFRLRVGSPASDAGERGLAPPTDFEGAVRPQGTDVDVGADESG